MEQSSCTSSYISDSDKLNILFKHHLDKPNTNPKLEFFEETTTCPSTNYVFQENIISKSIPTSVPDDIANLGDGDLDDNGFPLEGSYAGITSIIDSNIRYYHKIPLEYIQGSDGHSFQSIDAGPWSHPYGIDGDIENQGFNNDENYGRVMQGSIPFNYTGGQYKVTLYRSSNGRATTAIPFRIGGSYIDARPGIVTFFSGIDGVSKSSPVFASFYRYIGPTGAAASSSFGTDITNVFTEPQIFNGGREAAVSSDLLSAIIVDDRNINMINNGDLLKCLQIGGNHAGSFRICVQKLEYGSRFLVQSRDAHSWVTRSSLTVEKSS